MRAGVEALEVDVNPNHELWLAKVEQLQQLTPSLSSCKAHVSSAVSTSEFGAKIKHLSRKLRNIQASVPYDWRILCCTTFNTCMPPALMQSMCKVS